MGPRSWPGRAPASRGGTTPGCQTVATARGWISCPPRCRRARAGPMLGPRSKCSAARAGTGGAPFWRCPTASRARHVRARVRVGGASAIRGRRVPLDPGGARGHGRDGHRHRREHGPALGAPGIGPGPCTGSPRGRPHAARRGARSPVPRSPTRPRPPPSRSGCSTAPVARSPLTRRAVGTGARRGSSSRRASTCRVWGEPAGAGTRQVPVAGEGTGDPSPCCGGTGSWNRRDGSRSRRAARGSGDPDPGGSPPARALGRVAYAGGRDERPDRRHG